MSIRTNTLRAIIFKDKFMLATKYSVFLYFVKIQSFFVYFLFEVQIKFIIFVKSIVI